jgi:hypothetical protein
MPQNTPGDARELVGQRRGQLVLVHALRCLLQPWAEAEFLPVMGAHQDDMRRLHEQGAQVSAATLRYAPQDRLAAGAELPWHKPNPGAEIASPVEGLARADGGDNPPLQGSSWSIPLPAQPSAGQSGRNPRSNRPD